MLAGEEFTDRPRCVDPVISAFLRAFNDRLGDRARQRLYPYAALAVHTRGEAAKTRARREACLDYAGARPLPRVRIAALTRLRLGLRIDEGAGEFAARQAIARGDVEGGFALLDRLIGRDRLEAAALASALEVRPQLRITSARPQLELDPR